MSIVTEARQGLAWSSVPGMENLAEMADLVTEFAAREHLMIVPAIPAAHDGPQVQLGLDEMDLPEFLELAGKLGGGAIYLQSVRFDPGEEEDLPDGAAGLLKYEGHISRVTVAFAAGGVMHFWEDEASWYVRWEVLTDPENSHGADGRLGDEERARRAGELAAALLADPKFRGDRGNRWRIAQQAISRDTDDWVSREAISQAGDQADRMAQEQYDQIEGQLDTLAAELLTSPAWQQARSAAARKQAAVRFLIPRADGFSPPALMRDELYARARDLAKANKTAGLDREASP